MGERTGVLSIVAALILGASFLGGSLLVQSSIENAATQIVESFEVAAKTPPPAPARPERAARPDPTRRYSVNTKGSPSRGPDDAKVSVVEFSDFQCPFCLRVNPTLAKIQEHYGDDVRIVFKHLPLRIHPQAPAAHAASEAAHRQGRFWEMHDKIFENPRQLTEEKFLEYAREIGLDVAKYEADVASEEVKAKVQADASEAARMGITGTPGFMINGRFLSGAQPFEAFQGMIDEELEG